MDAPTQDTTKANNLADEDAETPETTALEQGRTLDETAGVCTFFPGGACVSHIYSLEDGLYLTTFLLLKQMMQRNGDQ